MITEVVEYDGYMWVRLAVYFNARIPEAKKIVRREFPMHDIRDLEFKSYWPCGPVHRYDY